MLAVKHSISPRYPHRPRETGATAVSVVAPSLVVCPPIPWAGIFKSPEKGASRLCAQMPKWNDAEDAALDGLPHVDQIVYLRGIRRRMDYHTGISGADPKREISYFWLSQLTEVNAERGSTAAQFRPLKKEQLRALFRRLERRGLIQWIKSESRGLVFRCILADRDESVSRRNNPRTTLEQPQTNNPCLDDKNQKLTEQEQPTNNPSDFSRNNPIPEFRFTGREEESTAYSCSGSRPNSDARDILERLNEKAGTKFKAIGNDGKPTKSIELINARLKQHGKDLLLAVVDRKCLEWLSDDKTRDWVRPATLFGKLNCEQYVGQLSMPAKVPKAQSNRAGINAWLEEREQDRTVIAGKFKRES